MTKDTEKAFVIIYSEYLRRRNIGTAKNQAVWFEDSKLRKIDAFSTWNPEDIRCSLQELIELGYITMDIVGNVELSKLGIQYMERKPKEFFSAFSGAVGGIIDLVALFL